MARLYIEEEVDWTLASVRAALSSTSSSSIIDRISLGSEHVHPDCRIVGEGVATGSAVVLSGSSGSDIAVIRR